MSADNLVHVTDSTLVDPSAITAITSIANVVELVTTGGSIFVYDTTLQDVLEALKDDSPLEEDHL